MFFYEKRGYKTKEKIVQNQEKTIQVYTTSILFSSSEIFFYFYLKLKRNTDDLFMILSTGEMLLKSMYVH